MVRTVAMSQERVVKKVKRKGTVRLLHLTEGMDEEKAKELLGYIGYLEQSEDRLAGQICNFYNAVSEYNYLED